MEILRTGFVDRDITLALAGQFYLSAFPLPRIAYTEVSGFEACLEI